MAFAKVLRRLRVASGKSQEYFALISGIDRSYVSRLERGQLQPTISTLFVIADTLEIPASEIVKLVENEKKMATDQGAPSKRIKKIRR